jgi:hypothetical protein
MTSKAKVSEYPLAYKCLFALISALFKRKIFLRVEGESNNETSSDEFRHYSRERKGFYEYFKKEIIKQNGSKNYDHIFG